MRASQLTVNVEVERDKPEPSSIAKRNFLKTQKAFHSTRKIGELVLDRFPDELAEMAEVKFFKGALQSVAAKLF